MLQNVSDVVPVLKNVLDNLQVNLMQVPPCVRQFTFLFHKQYLDTLPGRPDSTLLLGEVWDRAEALVRGASPGDLNQALMELGATFCSPQSPECGRCPVRRFCRARQLGVVDRFPAPRL